MEPHEFDPSREFDPEQAKQDILTNGNSDLLALGEILTGRAKFFLILPEQPGVEVEENVFAGAAMMGGNGTLELWQIAEGLRYAADYIENMWKQQQRARREN